MEAVDPPRRKRDSEKSRQTILTAASAEFCTHGFTGARVERIATRAKANMRMLYHYFGSKEGLYTAVLESVYGQIRGQERALDLKNRPPIEGMCELVRFTFDFFARQPNFVALINNENLMKGRFLKRSPAIRAMTMPLIEAIEDLLHRGHATGEFRGNVDPVQLYVSIVAQSQLHISNRYTLSILFDRDLADPDWLAARRVHAQSVILDYLTARPSRS